MFKEKFSSPRVVLVLGEGEEEVQVVLVGLTVLGILGGNHLLKSMKTSGL